MKRSILLLLWRFLFAIGITFSLPVSHMFWGETYPGDGQKAFGFIIIFFVIGSGIATLYFAVGSVLQYLLRLRPSWQTFLADMAIFVAISVVLIYGGITASYD
ncbi:MAG: hypothetical protein IT426_02600 [Pirellulales bacterium]|nr:hypothetical protein [Pirellulales bacterium]